MAMKGAQPESEIRLPDIAETRQILDAGHGIICRWSAAPELPGSKIFADQVRQAGICLSVAHSEATCPVIQQAFDRGFHSFSPLPTFVSSGLGEIGLPLRFLNPPAIDVLEIH